MKFAMYSGKLIDITRFTEADVDIDDIAHNLSKIQRFNGASPINISYTVGEHCINLANYFISIGASTEVVLHALIHDASEAYMSDVVSPVKRAVKDYVALENKVQQVVRSKFKLESEDREVKKADKRMLADEVESIIPLKIPVYESEMVFNKLGCHIFYNHHPSTTKLVYLKMFKQLLGV